MISILHYCLVCSRLSILIFFDPNVNTIKRLCPSAINGVVSNRNYVVG